MPRYIAFLRAINVGGHFVTMDQLRQHFEALGLSQVETFINSGNVAFVARGGSAASREKKLEAHLTRSMGYSISVFLRTPAEVAAIAAFPPFSQPLPAAGGLYIAFAQAPLPPDVQTRLDAFQSEYDRFRVNQREVYWWRATGYSDSPLSGSGKFEKLLGVPATVRNVTTVRKLAAKYPPT